MSVQPKGDFARSAASLARLLEAKERIAQFKRDRVYTIFGKLVRRLNFVSDDYFRIGESVIWHRFERNDRYPDRSAFRVIVGRKRQVPLSLPVLEGRRRAFPCERTVSVTGEPRRIMWNPAQLGIGSEDRELPVFVSEHAINRLHERMAAPTQSSALHIMMDDALAEPNLRPTEGDDGFLVEVKELDAKVGYLVVEVYAEFIFVKTFLFLTMQGTPEATCLRQKLGLSRRDIEYFKLDNLFTLAYSDLGEDPELRRALADCGCDYLLDIFNPTTRLSWLKRYRDPLRRELGLPSRPENLEDQAANPAYKLEIERMIAFSQRALKTSQGWTV